MRDSTGQQPPTAAPLASRRGAVALLLAVLTGCSLGPQTAPVPAAPLAATPPPAAASVPDRTLAVVYLVRDQRLAPVARSSRPGLQGALDVLSAGPGPRDEQIGLRSYLTAQQLEAAFDPELPGLVVVGITDAFGALPEDQRLLAAAQLVWTATHAPGVDRVLAQTGGRPVPLPTPAGPRDRPVGREDYLPLMTGPS